ncbi:hypothetical protein [Bacillus mesophilum]|uniref:Spore coat protein n=1 Tax=Bacillus mesophilum TaxID=1071718 RepID=A0A7V7RQN1_9BACI|nr:hypothetical protein [Bacillus mesophilum]KAB2335774.1 hypothetical protein F7732_04185 [Bacillus mesophilum]
MRKEIMIPLAAVFFFSLSAITAAFANENEKLNTVFEAKQDVTGDGQPDHIYIKGLPYDEGAGFLKEIKLEIMASNGKTYTKDLEPGYEPSIVFQDLNHDHVKDMLIMIPTGGSGGLSHYYLYTLKDFKLKDVGIPEGLTTNSQFLDGYKAKLEIQNTGQTFEFDLKDRKKEYDRLGLYQNGKLNEPLELMIDPYGSMKPVLFENGQYGLRAVQGISGAYHADGIGYIESTWLYKNGKWELQDVKVMKNLK